ncbi:MAG TPA: hypothetical protein VLD37_05725 [Candidatus Bilamarchaeum sp.]|nr:hypothetical protein [Candidatus Bilamarchaeum sp.]
MSFDFKKLLMASILVMGIGVVLVIVGEILATLSLVVTGENAGTFDTISTVYSVLMIPVFFILYFWCGMRAAKRYNFDPVGSGWVTAFSYFITSLVHLVLNLLLNLVIVSKAIAGSGVGSAESVLASSLFGGVVGLSGVGLSAFCGIALIFFGTMMNFVVGGSGAIFVLRKTNKYD